MNYVGKTFGNIKVLSKIELEGFEFNGYYRCERNGKVVRISEEALKHYVDENPIVEEKPVEEVKTDEQHEKKPKTKAKKKKNDISKAV